MFRKELLNKKTENKCMQIVHMIAAYYLYLNLECLSSIVPSFPIPHPHSNAEKKKGWG